MIEQILERGEIAVIVTLVSGPGLIGAKLLVEENGENGATAGSLGDLDSWVVEKAPDFLASREETRMFTVNETSLLFVCRILGRMMPLGMRYVGPTRVLRPVTKFALKMLKKSKRASRLCPVRRRIRFANRMFHRLVDGRAIVPIGSMFSTIWVMV